MSQTGNKENWGDFSDQNFEFKEEFWNEAEELLKQDQKQTKVKRFSVALSLLLFLSLWTWWLSDQHDTFQAKNQMTESVSFIDTSDQLRAEKYRTTEYENYKKFPIEVSKEEEKQFEKELNSLSNNNVVKKAKQTQSHSKIKHQNVLAQKNKSIKTIISKKQTNAISDGKMSRLHVKKSLVETEKSSPEFSHSIELPDAVDFHEPITKRSRWSIGIGSGVNLMTASSNQTLQQNYSVSIYFKAINRKKFSFDIGAGVKTVQLHGLDTAFVHKTYDFGSSNRITDVDYKQNIYAYMPLHFNFHLKKHKFTATAGVGYLMATETSLQTRKIEYKSNTSSLTNNISRNYGIKDGIQPWTFDFGVQYNYQLGKQLDIGAEVMVGLNDITNNEFWNNNNNQRYVSGNLTLRYHLKSLD